MRTDRAAPGAVRVLAWLLVAAAALPPPASAQVLQGRVLDDEDEHPLEYALVQLLDREGRVQAAATADSAGEYRIEAPEPGEYTLLAERLGYDPFRSLLLALPDAEAVHAVDIGLRRVPLPVEGITVTAERIDRLERAIHLAVALDPASLRHRPILRPEIMSHVRRAHGLEDMMRSANVAGLVVRYGTDGPCFAMLRRRTATGYTCVPVYLNEWRAPAWVAETTPLENIEVIVVLHPLESIKYPGGAILLYTAGFIR